MRMLADNPSMEFLRREAKDLLDVLRDSNEGATLADAQRATAQEYGFRTWSELKAEVDRRRSEVPAAPAGLTEGIVDAFGLGRIAGPIEPIRYEYMGRRWLLQTDRGRFVLRPVFGWIVDAQAEIAVDLQERARAAGVRSPVPVRTPDGGLVRRVLDQNWRVEEWMDLGPTPVEPVPSAVAERAGAVLATIHEVAPNTDRPIQGPWVSPTERPTEAQWAALWERARAADCDWAPDLARLSPAINELSEVTTEAPPQSSVLISNCDLGVQSVRIGQGDDLVVMHWDFSGPMVADWELAGTLFHWTQSGANLDAARALLTGYRKQRGYVPALTLASFSSTITGWLTWLLHRAWEAADPEPSEKRDYATRTLREVLDDPLSVAKLTAMVETAAVAEGQKR